MSYDFNYSSQLLHSSLFISSLHSLISCSHHTHMQTHTYIHTHSHFYMIWILRWYKEARTYATYMCLALNNECYWSQKIPTVNAISYDTMLPTISSSLLISGKFRSKMLKMDVSFFIYLHVFASHLWLVVERKGNDAYILNSLTLLITRARVNVPHEFCLFHDHRFMTIP